MKAVIETSKVMERDEKAAKVFAEFGIEVDQIYLDNDKREHGRRIRVLSVTSKPGKAACASCDREGRNLGKTLWIQFKRLSTKRLYTHVDTLKNGQLVTAAEG